MKYDPSFFDAQQDGSLASARAVVPVVLEYVQPRSVVDMGAGVGTWLTAFLQAGIEDAMAVDGDYVRPEMLRIPPEQFVAKDLARPVELERRFDLVVSLEVAEHLPASVAETFVDTLTAHGEVVLFSAAIPHQWGTHHVNEQWPEYWAQKFRRRGFRVVDCLRSRLWNDERVEACYRQNILFYATDAGLDANPALRQAAESSPTEALALVHPWWYLMHSEPDNAYLRHAVPQVVAAAKNAVGRRLASRRWALRGKHP